MVVFRGGRFQRGYGQVGYGLGSFFQSLARRALPFLQKGVKTVGRAAINTGMNIAQDVLAGGDLKRSAKARVQQSVGNLKDQAANYIIPQTGNGSRNKNKKKPIKRKAPKKSITSNQASKGKRAKIGPSAVDIFGR